MAVILKRVFAVAASALLTFAVLASAQELKQDHPSQYVVQKGDTLWDIAARFLTKPWLWPEIWQANPQIENPHLIYPGDVISLAYLQGQPKVSAERPAEIRRSDAIPTIPLSDIEPFLRDLHVLDSLDGLPYVVATEEDRIYATAGGLIHVRGLSGGSPGDAYAVVRQTFRYGRAEQFDGKVHARAEQLDRRGDLLQGRDWHNWWRDQGVGAGTRPEILGYEVMTLALAKVTRFGDPSSLVLQGEGREVREGDLLIPVTSQPYDLQFMPRAPSSISDGARVLSVADGLWGSGPRYVVALSLGAEDGISNGHVLSVWSEGLTKPDRIQHRNPLAAANNTFKVPDDFNGHVMVFRTFDRISYGLIMDGIRPVKVGDLLKMPDEYY
ncbi:MAG: LysM peptidoglycan-binding domain-containing protein [Xanthomonadaceae bacterium]|nr:LysM peptidoglycan-binding domain-containing protein [Xanthomonadaceae bacterium]